MRKIIIVGRQYSIEPLGILHLVGLAQGLGWNVQLVLVENFNFHPLFQMVRWWKPDVVGFSVWTGYHVQAFKACDVVRKMGVPVMIGGPHATYFAEECKKHAVWVIQGEGFRNFRRVLQGELGAGIHFDSTRLSEGFPPTGRDLVYKTYPHLASSPIKSIMCSIGCPFTCSYCYAPVNNAMYGGFRLSVRKVSDVVNEALYLREHWPLSMVYFQDDIFGFRLDWLKEFVQEWKTKVGVPWHCQIRLELTQDERRLDLFREGGCTGITVAVESGNEFLRRYVLHREMSDELIIQGIRRIKDRGFTLRLEQILAVPFSDIATDLETLKLNCDSAPEVAWTSVLVPYGGTEMGNIASRFGFYNRGNDALDETFFNRSVLRHVMGGPSSIEFLIRSLIEKGEVGRNPLIEDLEAKNHTGNIANLYRAGSSKPVGTFQYLSRKDNDRYCDQTVILQRIFDWFSKVPEGYRLAKNFVSLPSSFWTWDTLGGLTKSHLARLGYSGKMAVWETELAHALGYASVNELPAVLQANPHYFTFLPSGDRLAEEMVDVLAEEDQQELFRRLGNATRHWV